MYVCPADGKVSVVFRYMRAFRARVHASSPAIDGGALTQLAGCSLAFRDTTDDEIARVFLKEFATAKKDPKLGAQATTSRSRS